MPIYSDDDDGRGFDSPYALQGHTLAAAGSAKHLQSLEFQAQSSFGGRTCNTVIQQAERLHSAHFLRLPLKSHGEEIDVLKAWKENILQDATMVKRNDPRVWTRFRLFLNRLCSVPRDPSEASAIDEIGGLAMHPRSSMALLVSLVSGIFLIFTVFLVPFELAFFWNVEPCEGAPTLELNLVVDTFFMFEIFITFFTGRFISGEYVRSLSGVAKDYCVSGHLIFDLTTSIPVSWIEFAQREECRATGKVESGAGVSILRALRIVKPLRLLRLLRMLKLVNHRVFRMMQENIRVSNDALRLIGLGLGVIIMCHLCACFFWMVKILSTDTCDVNDWLHRQKFRGSWECADSDEAECFDPDCFKEPLFSVYVVCFYFAMTALTTVGFGDIFGENNAERIFLTILQLTGAVVFATIMSQLSSVITNMSQSQREREQHIEGIRSFLIERKVERSLATKITDWAAFNFSTTTSLRETLRILGLLPLSLKHALALSLHEATLSAIPMFYRAGSEFIAQVALHLIHEVYEEGETVLKSGQASSSLYIVGKGTCIVTDSSNRLISTLGRGDYIGENNLLNPQIQRVTVTTQNFCELWALSHHALHRIAKRFPVVERKLAERAARTTSVLVPGQMFMPAESAPSSAEENQQRDPVCVLRWVSFAGRALRKRHVSEGGSRLMQRLAQFSHDLFGSLEEEARQAAEAEGEQGAGSEEPESPAKRAGSGPGEDDHSVRPSARARRSGSLLGTLKGLKSAPRDRKSVV